MSDAPKVKPLEFDKYDNAMGAGAKFMVYEFGRDGAWNAVCYPHEGPHYTIADSVSREGAVAAANADNAKRVIRWLEQ